MIKYNDHRLVTVTTFFQHHTRDTISSFVQRVISQRVFGGLDRQPVSVQGDDFLKTIRHGLINVADKDRVSLKRLLGPRRGSLLENVLIGYVIVTHDWTPVLSYVS